MSAAVRVAIRSRPFNSNEKSIGIDGQLCIDMNQKNVTVTEQNGDEKTYTYDRAYWSTDNSRGKMIDQVDVYTDIGKETLNNSMDGYNACIFSYGQTGTGKSWSMTGDADHPGIIPRMIDDVFQQKAKIDEDSNQSLHIFISYYEIHNDKLHDLLQYDHAVEMKIQEHPMTGVFIQNLQENIATSVEDVQWMIDWGNRRRDSRSHVVFAMTLKRRDNAKKCSTATINCVDLAGFDRVSAIGAAGSNLMKETCAINSSLSDLALVIETLAANNSKPKKKQAKVPFHNSVLTHVLKNSLAGNSKTWLIATISPHLNDVEETLSTLRFASSIKAIKLAATIQLDKRDDLLKLKRLSPDDRLRALEKIELNRHTMIKRLQQETALAISGINFSFYFVRMFLLFSRGQF